MSFAPCKQIRIRESGKFLLVESGIRNQENLICEIRNPGHWNPEYSSRNPKSHQRLKSGIPIPLTKNIESRIWNQEYTVRNPESKTVLDSGIQEIFACGIQNPGNICLWILESWALKRGIQIKESGTSLLIGIWNPVP